MTKNIKQIGIIGVDSGTCWIGDPCYFLHREEGPAAVGENWADFCKKFGDDRTLHKQFHFDQGHAGLGVAVTTGEGDGVYPVFAEIVDGRVEKVWVDFTPQAA